MWRVSALCEFRRPCDGVIETELEERHIHLHCENVSDLLQNHILKLNTYSLLFLRRVVVGEWKHWSSQSCVR